MELFAFDVFEFAKKVFNSYNKLYIYYFMKQLIQINDIFKTFDSESRQNLQQLKNISQEDDTFVIYTEPQACDKVKQAVVDLGASIKEAELEWVPKTMVQLDPGQEEKALHFLDKIEDLEDVQNVYANLE